MFYELEEHRDANEQRDYVLLGAPESTSLADKLATSKPAVAIDRFNRSFMDLIVSSLGFVAALSWSDYLKSLFTVGGAFYHVVGKSGPLYVALFVSVLAYLATVLVTWMYPDREIAKKENPLERGVTEQTK